MNLIENPFVVKGQVRILVEEEGREFLHFDGPNLIVKPSKKVLSHLLASAASGCKIGLLKIGTGLSPYTAITTDDTGLVTPGSGVITNVSLRSPTPFEFLPDTTTPTAVKFVFILTASQGNGTGIVDYREAGLFISHIALPTSDFPANKCMFAREVFPSLVKNATRKITFEWTITF